MDGWARAAQLIVAARSRRFRTQQEFADEAGVSKRLIGDLETGRRSNYTDAKLAAIESVLGWEPGSIRSLAHGGRVKIERDEAMIRLLDVWPLLSSDARRILAEVAERAIRD